MRFCTSALSRPERPFASMKRVKLTLSRNSRVLYRSPQRQQQRRRKKCGIGSVRGLASTTRLFRLPHLGHSTASDIFASRLVLERHVDDELHLGNIAPRHPRLLTVSVDNALEHNDPRLRITEQRSAELPPGVIGNAREVLLVKRHLLEEIGQAHV